MDMSFELDSEILTAYLPNFFDVKRVERHLHIHSCSRVAIPLPEPWSAGRCNAAIRSSPDAAKLIGSFQAAYGSQLTELVNGIATAKAAAEIES
jgi:hypothetical protein